MSDDDFKVHPKKTADELGSLAATENGWYENELDGSNDDESDVEEEAVPTMPTMPFPSFGTASIENPEQLQRKRKVGDSADISANLLVSTSVDSIVSSAEKDDELLNKLIEYSIALGDAARSQLNCK